MKIAFLALLILFLSCSEEPVSPQSYVDRSFTDIFIDGYLGLSLDGLEFGDSTRIDSVIVNLSSYQPGFSGYLTLFHCRVPDSTGNEEEQTCLQFPDIKLALDTSAQVFIPNYEMVLQTPPSHSSYLASLSATDLGNGVWGRVRVEWTKLEKGE